MKRARDIQEAEHEQLVARMNGCACFGELMPGSGRQEIYRIKDRHWRYTFLGSEIELENTINNT